MRAIPTLKISISGVRGVIGDSLSPTLLTRFAQAFGTYIGPSTVVIGRDPRTSGEMVKQAVIAGLLSSGCRVTDIGMVPVPTIQLLVRRNHAQGGIAITASHNPAEWNALKFIGADGLFLDSGQAREMLDIDFEPLSDAPFLATVNPLFEGSVRLRHSPAGHFVMRNWSGTAAITSR